jgi:hypothetical protein
MCQKGKGLCGTCSFYEARDKWKGWCRIKQEIVWGVTKWERCHVEREGR